MSIPAKRKQIRGREDPGKEKSEERRWDYKSILLIEYSILNLVGFFVFILDFYLFT